MLLAYYPARGLDVSNAEAMRKLLLAYRSQGVAILLVSEDMDELFALSDRLVVMYHGRIVGTFRPQDTNADAVGHLMTGGEARARSSGRSTVEGINEHTGAKQPVMAA